MRAWEPQVTEESKDWTSTCSGFSSQTKAKEGCWISGKGAAVEGRELRSKMGKTSSNIHSRIGPPHIGQTLALLPNRRESTIILDPPLGLPNIPECTPSVYSI